jgi:hypothetical protein
MGFRSLKGRKFTAVSVGKLLRATEPTKYLTPKQYLETMLRNLEQEHNKLHPDEPFRWPGFPRLAVALTEAGYLTPKGHDHWLPAQVQQHQNPTAELQAAKDEICRLQGRVISAENKRDEAKRTLEIKRMLFADRELSLENQVRQLKDQLRKLTA